MFKKILIISDNPALCKKFHQIIEKKKFNNSSFSFAISPFSSIHDFNISDEVLVQTIDLRNQDNIDNIKSNFDLVFSIHCKQIFPSDLVTNVKCINVHPGYNPINRGWYPQVFSIINKIAIGATIHEIDEKLDHGAIIARKFVEKDSFDTSESLYNKITDLEIELLEEHIESIIGGTYSTISPEEEGNLYLKKDFNNLLQLDLEEKVTVGDFIDKLRALTHGSYDNAYFIDQATGKKVFVGIRLKQE